MEWNCFHLTSHGHLFSDMLRVFKNYKFSFHNPSTKAGGSSFSSFPGSLPSGDDYYINSNNMVVMETTNGVMNVSLFQNVKTTTVMYWIRVIVANRMADSGAQWSNFFAQYNSGTYSNQWIIVDNRKFVPGEPIAHGTLYIAEQIPGTVMGADQSHVLAETGRWVSYNIPFYKYIYDISCYPEYFQKYGNAYSYSRCARAQIFARDYKKVSSMGDMKKIMRYNKWQTDPLALGDACRGISARCDLNDPSTNGTLNGYTAFGGIDCKLTSNKISQDSVSHIVSGPTWDAQPIFVWNDQWTYFPSYGMPRIFGFDWTTNQPLSN